MQLRPQWRESNFSDPAGKKEGMLGPPPRRPAARAPPKRPTSTAVAATSRCAGPPPGSSCCRSAPPGSAPAAVGNEGGVGAKLLKTSLLDENASLRRELAEMRQQNLVLLANPPVEPSEPRPAAYVLESQLRHANRRIEVLCEALTQRHELGTELEAVLTRLRDQGRSGSSREPAAPRITPEWAEGALSRVRTIHYGQQLASALIEQADAAQRTPPRPRDVPPYPPNFRPGPARQRRRDKPASPEVAKLIESIREEASLRDRFREEKEEQRKAAARAAAHARSVERKEGKKPAPAAAQTALLRKGPGKGSYWETLGLGELDIL